MLSIMSRPFRVSVLVQAVAWSVLLGSAFAASFPYSATIGRPMRAPLASPPMLPMAYNMSGELVVKGFPLFPDQVMSLPKDFVVDSDVPWASSWWPSLNITRLIGSVPLVRILNQPVENRGGDDARGHCQNVLHFTFFTTTGDVSYELKAWRFVESCNKFGLPCVAIGINGISWVGEKSRLVRAASRVAEEFNTSPMNRGLLSAKPYLFYLALKYLGTKVVADAVVYVDSDFEYVQFPAFFCEPREYTPEKVEPDIMVFNHLHRGKDFKHVHYYAPEKSWGISMASASGVMYFRRVDRVLKLLEDWNKLQNFAVNIRAADDIMFDYLWTACDWRSELVTLTLPIEYFCKACVTHYSHRHELEYRDVKPVLLHDRGAPDTAHRDQCRPQWPAPESDWFHRGCDPSRLKAGYVSLLQRRKPCGEEA